MYFLGQWEEQFPAGATRERPFRLADGSEVAATLMTQTKRLELAETDALQVLQLRYRDSTAAMMILLPHQQRGLSDLERTLDAATLAKWSQTLEYRQVAADVPKFTFEAEMELSRALAALGMNDAFDDRRADFSGISDADRLIIQAVQHQAYVSVDEYGTEAAAATGVSMGVTSVPAEPPVVFRADRPFVFLIRDRTTGAVLFLGRVTNPRG